MTKILPKVVSAIASCMFFFLTSYMASFCLVLLPFILKPHQPNSSTQQLLSFLPAPLAHNFTDWSSAPIATATATGAPHTPPPPPPPLHHNTNSLYEKSTVVHVSRNLFRIILGLALYRVIDRIGNCGVGFAALIAYKLIAVAYMFSTSFWTLLATRSAESFQALFMMVVAHRIAAVISRHSSRLNLWVTGLGQLCFAFADMVGPGIGAILTQGYGQRVAFATFLVFSSVTLVFFTLHLKLNGELDGQPSHRRLGRRKPDADKSDADKGESKMLLKPAGGKANGEVKEEEREEQENQEQEQDEEEKGGRIAATPLTRTQLGLLIACICVNLTIENGTLIGRATVMTVWLAQDYAFDEAAIGTFWVISGLAGLPLVFLINLVNSKWPQFAYATLFTNAALNSASWLFLVCYRPPTPASLILANLVGFCTGYSMYITVGPMALHFTKYYYGRAYLGRCSFLLNMVYGGTQILVYMLSGEISKYCGFVLYSMVHAVCILLAGFVNFHLAGYTDVYAS